MKVGVLVPPELGGSADPDWLGAFAGAAERLGFDELSLVEHSVVVRDTSSAYPYAPDGRSPLPDDCPLPDPLEALAYVAGRTTTLGLATSVLVLPNHHPVVLAKRLATLDRLSAGRLRVCLGLGWMREEIEACGGDFDHRGTIADEAIEVMRALWRGTDPNGVDHAGAAYRFSGAHSWPKPVRPDGVPLYIGGHSRAAARRAGRLGDGFQPLGLSGAALTGALADMRAEAERCGRDASGIDLVLGSTLGRADAERLDAARDVGASRVLLSPSRGTDGLAALLDELAACSQRLGLCA